MVEPQIPTEWLWLDHHYRKISAYLENLAMIEKNTKDHQTRLLLFTQQQAVKLALLDIEKRMEVVKTEWEPGA